MEIQDRLFSHTHSKLASGILAGSILYNSAKMGYKASKETQDDVVKKYLDNSNFYKKEAEKLHQRANYMRTRKWKEEDKKWREECPTEVTGEEETADDVEDNAKIWDELSNDSFKLSKKYMDQKEFKKYKKDNIKRNIKYGALQGTVLGGLGASAVLGHKLYKLKKH